MAMMLVSIVSESASTTAPLAKVLHEVLRALLWALLVWFPSLHRGARKLRLAFLLSCCFAAWSVLLVILSLTGTASGTSGFVTDATANTQLTLSWTVLQAAAVAHLSP